MIKNWRSRRDTGFNTFFGIAKMTKDEIIARMKYLLTCPEIDNEGSAEAAEFDRLEAEFLAQYGDWEFGIALDKILAVLHEA